jgi:hypothetical protein
VLVDLDQCVVDTATGPHRVALKKRGTVSWSDLGEPVEQDSSIFTRSRWLVGCWLRD